MDRARGTNFFVRQAAILAAVGILARLLGFLYRIPLTNLIGDEGNAIYGIGYSVYNFFLIVSSAGLPAAVSKLVSEKRAIGRHDAAHRIFVIALVLAISMGAFFTLAIFIFAEEITAMLGRPQAYLALQMLAPTVFIFAIMATIRGYFQGMSQTVPTAVSQLIEQIFNAIFSVVLAHAMFNFALGQGYATVVYGAAGGTAGTTVGALAGFIVISGLYFIARPDILRNRRNAWIRAKSRSRHLDDERRGQVAQKIIITSSTIIAGTAIFSIVNLIDTWLVLDRLAYADFEETHASVLLGQLTGKFNPITNLPAAISSSLALVLIPAIATAKQLDNREDMHAKINAAFRAAMLLTIPIAFGLGVLGPQIVALLFPNHPDGGTLFVVGFASVIFLAFSQISTGVLQAIGKISIPVMAALAGAVVKIAAGYFLIAHPAINIYGAIIGTTLCYLVAAMINMYFLSKYTGTRLDFAGMVLKPAAASIAMALACYTAYHLIYTLLPSNAVATVAAIFAGMIVYGFFMAIIRGLKEEDMHILPKGERLAQALKSRGFI
ncbi:MAG: polysaccharide biosynthesis protein [Clostridiales bacterium]|jgi:stage V sporulation protein B|nr:polysaccharide biosynthesis protein [Clostridiales bacterium]